MIGLAQFFTQAVTVETYTGPGELGDQYAAPVTVVGLLDDGLSLSHGPTGDVLTSSTSFYTHLGNAALFRPESRVTANGNVMQVESVKPREGPGMLRQLEHLEVQLR